MKNNEDNTNIEKISVIVKTKNSGNTLCDTLESIKDFDEIFVLDFNSVDDTVDIANEYKVKIVFSDKKDVDIALNQIIQETKNNWILLLEDDEIISYKLFLNLDRYIQLPKKNRFGVKFLIKYFLNNKEIKAGNIKEIRLVKKDNIKFLNGKISEKNIKTIEFKKDSILKYKENNSYKKYLDIIEKNEILSKRNIKTGNLILKTFFVFIYYYFLKRAFLSGKNGFIFAFDKMIEEYILLVMAQEKQNKEKEEENDL